jgi:predicted DsbA family dithiol-disulfide isomerase
MSYTEELLRELIEEPIVKMPPKKPTPVGIRDLPGAERKTYKAQKQAERRAKLRDRADGGSVKFDMSSAREALADAALMILASGAEGSASIERYLGKVYHDQSGALLTIKANARSGRLKPRLLNIAMKSS